MKEKFRVILLLMVAVFSVMGISCYAASNASGNISNYGYAVSDGTYVFYAADKKLYRESVSGGNKRILQEDRLFASLVVDGDYLYYQTSSTGTNSGSIYRMRKDGSENDFVTYCDADAYIAIKDGYMYYKNSHTIIKRNVNSGKSVELAETHDAFVVSGNKIYFNNDNSDAGGVGLASIDLNGESFESYYVGKVGCINIYDNYIYYTDDNQIWKIPTKRGDPVSLCECKSYWINVYNDYIYFYEKGNLARISVNGKNKATSTLEVSSVNCIVENKVYSRHTDNFNKVSINNMPSFKSDSSDGSSISSNSNSNISKSKYSNVSSWAQNEVDEAEKNGLIPEYFEGKDLTEEITREEFAAIAVKLYEKLSGRSISGSSTPFKDIYNSSLKSDIQKAYKANIAVGISDTEFAPKVDINREQLATMLCRVIKKYSFPEWSLSVDEYYHMSGSSGKKFADDSDISDYAKDSVYFMASIGIIQGVGDNKFAPKNITTRQEAMGYANATREQAAVMSNRIFKVKDIF